MKKHYVDFYSPGTLVAETSRREIESWDVVAAMAMADEITERYGATPYGFRFVTRERKDDDMDAKVVDSSGMYFLGGTKLTLADVKARHDPRDSILVANMENNDISAVIENTNSWKTVQPFRKDDVLLDYTPPAKRQEVCP